MLEGLLVAGAAQKMSRAKQAQTEGQMAARSAAKVRTQNDSIQYDVDKLYMVVEALWNFLKEQHNYSDDDLMKMITKIDAQDGKIDGKSKTKVASQCSQCGRVLVKRQNRCLYCGTINTPPPFER